MKKFLLIAMILCSGCKVFSKQNLSKMISLTQNGETYPAEKGSSFYFYSEEFDINFDNLKTDEDICLFAYHNSKYQNKYMLPIKCDSTAIFNQGCAEAEYDLNVEKGYTLRINEEHDFHCIFDTRRINTEKGAVIPVRYIADRYGNYKGSLYLSIWVDFNKNKSIEENEYSTLTIYFPLYSESTELDFSDNHRAYFSSMGHAPKRESFTYTGKEFKVYRISCHSDFEKVCQIENPLIKNNCLENIYLHTFDDKNLQAKTTYLCIIPEGFTQEGNTFRVRGSSTIFLEVVEDNPENERCINLREFNLPSDQPIPDVAFYFNGKIIRKEVTVF